MTKDKLAEMLNGHEYGSEISDELAKQAKASGLVVVYGASDDLMEFEGAIYDECGAPTTALVDGRGLLPDRDSIDDDDELEEWFARKKKAGRIESLWNGGEGYAWTFKTDIPHATFEIVEDGKPFCQGIIFRLADVRDKPV